VAPGVVHDALAAIFDEIFEKLKCLTTTNNNNVDDDDDGNSPLGFRLLQIEDNYRTRGKGSPCRFGAID
jgi:hypothetical protein